jgi:multidrug resistance efflux pump
MPSGIPIPPRAAPGVGSLPVTPDGVDPDAVLRAKQEIQSLIREIAQLAKSDVEPAAFYEALLSRVVEALAATGGAVWTLDESGQLQLAYQINLTKTDLHEHPERQAQHARLLGQILQADRPSLVPPNSGLGDAAASSAAANPTDSLLVVAPLKSDAGAQGVLEVFQRVGARTSTQRGYLRFLVQVAELAGDYLKGRRLRSFVDKQSLWEQLETFTREVHQHLDTRQTAFTVVNEGRRLIGCDRVSVLIRDAHRYRTLAISGQDSIDRRSNTVSRLERLAARVCATGESCWFTGDTSEMPPQVENAMQAYVDLSHAKLVAVLPLAKSTHASQADGEGEPRSKTASPARIIGALVVEQIEDSQPRDGLLKRVEVLREHSGTALANAAEHQSLFLMPVWKALGKAKWVVQARTLPKSIAVLAVLAAVVLGLLVIPADFELESRGVLQPAVQRDVFAGIDGVVIDVPADHGKQVEAGAPLAMLRNTELEVRLTDLVGRREATGEQMRSMERAMLDQARLSVDEQNRLSGELVQLRKTYESLSRQINLLTQKQQQLAVKSPIAGQVVTWQVRERLLRRPVRQGQILMRVADPVGDWQLELHVPEDRMGHIAKAAAASDEPLRVEYIVATNPGQTFEGRIVEMHSAAELRGEEGNTVLVRVAIDRRDLADLRPGASVTARIDCGSRSLGYVWLHDVIGFVQSKILFRL